MQYSNIGKYRIFVESVVFPGNYAFVYSPTQDDVYESAVEAVQALLDSAPRVYNDSVRFLVETPSANLLPIRAVKPSQPTLKAVSA